MSQEESVVCWDKYRIVKIEGDYALEEYTDSWITVLDPKNNVLPPQKCYCEDHVLFFVEFFLGEVARNAPTDKAALFRVLEIHHVQQEGVESC